jgi:hypothetical protein
MFRLASLSLALGVGLLAQQNGEPAGLLDRFLERIKSDLTRLPDYVCTESTDRFSRAAAERPWEKVDSLRFEVAMVKNRELYALPGGRFQDRPLAAMVGRGTTATGQLGILARHVFVTSTAKFSYRNTEDRDGRRLVGYDFEVPPERSSYKLRAGTAESAVGFQGAFWLDSETLDLVRLELEAFDIPEKLGIAQAETALDYARTAIDGSEVLLPALAKLTVVAVNGHEDLNRARIADCRHYRVDSEMRFDEVSKTETAPAATLVLPKELPAGTMLELRLESSLDPNSAQPGDAVRAILAKSLKSGDEVLIAEGAAVLGRVARLDVQSQPFKVHVIALEFDALTVADRRLQFAATMQEAGPVPGLLKQAKRLDPKFERHAGRRMEVLVREVQRGQGILLWDAKRGALPKGLRMRWRVD